MTKLLQFGGNLINYMTSSGDGNMSLKAPMAEQQIQNRTNFFKQIGLSLNNTVFCQQTHSDHIYVVHENDVGRGSLSFETGIPDTDALLTDVPGIAINILVADCVPILLHDPAKKVVGVVHAGWRGTMKHILEKTVQKMIAQYGSDPKDIVAEIGPSIGPSCFEVGKEVIIAAHDAELGQFIIKRNEKTFFDLWESNKYQLTKSGVVAKNIILTGICNHCSKDYFSFRRDNNTNRFAVGIAVR